MGTPSLETARGAGSPAVTVITVVRNSPLPLQETFESLAAQTFRDFEHVVVDGASDDETLDVIRGREDRIARWTTEPDEGVYDAINKGIRLSRGRYVAILHAGDVYEPDFLARAVRRADAAQEAAGPAGAVVFANYRHGDRDVEADDLSDGVFLHHLGVNHSTFLVPKAVYDAVGLYDPSLKIVSDAIWMRQAWMAGVRFVRVDGYPLRFAPGGLSQASTPEQRALVIGEWVQSYRRFFPFLSLSIAEALYLHRFEEGKIFEIRSYLQEVDLGASAHPEVERFFASLRIMLRRIWRDRPLTAGRDELTDRCAVVRMQVAALLGLDSDCVNLTVSGRKLTELLDAASAFGAEATAGGKAVTLHYLEVFSRATETFIPDLITAMEVDDGRVHVVVCDQRIRAEERPFARVLAFDPAGFHANLTREIYGALLERMAPDLFVFHFAVNGWRLLSRLDERWMRTPAIFMTHGIDVFDLPRPSPYRDMIIRAIIHLPNARFTTVSDYLRAILIEAGVPDDKIDLAPNAIHPRFLENHASGESKIAARSAAGGAVRLLNIGRLIGWKGQTTIVAALGEVVAAGVDARLTIVYGGETATMNDVQAAATAAGVLDRIDFVEWVNFEETPRFYENFDLFVSGSTYSNNVPPRSETFGLAVLEAMASGLPVVATTAGGQPEVVGGDGPFARLVPPDDPAAMADAILALIRSGATDGDNRAVAEERAATFSRRRQLETLARVRDQATAPRLRAGQFAMTLAGGAGGAAMNVHKSLLKAGVASRFFVRDADRNPYPAMTRAQEAARLITDAHQPENELRREDHTIFSIDTDGLGETLLTEIERDLDVVNFHWHARFVSNDDIARLTRSGKPIVFTIRDMHALTGGCHYFHGCDNWRRDCHPCPQFLPEENDLPRRVLAWRRANWDLRNVCVVVLSEHSRAIVERSALFAGARIERIPNPIDVSVFRPSPKAEARQAFDLPLDITILAYLPSTRSLVKGGAELRETLQRLKRRLPADNVLISMAGRAMDIEDCPFETVHAGAIADRDKLAQFYASADLVIAPSLEETFSNTVAEAISCGTPVAGFQTGAIADLAQGARGRTAAVGDTIGLADAVVEVLSLDVDQMGLHDYIRSFMTYEAIGARYKSLYEDLLEHAVPIEERAAEAPLDPERARSHYLARRQTSWQMQAGRNETTGQMRLGPTDTRATPAQTEVFENAVALFYWGWHDVERAQGNLKWRWSASQALVEVENDFDSAAKLVFEVAHLFGGDPKSVDFTVNGTPRRAAISRGNLPSGARYRYSIDVPRTLVAARRPLSVVVHCRKAGVPAETDVGSNDRRELGLALSNVALTPAWGPSFPLRLLPRR